MFLESLQDTRSINLITPAGKEKGITYLGQIFVAGGTYKNSNAAITACRRDLDLGLSALVIPEAGQFRVWCSIPTQMMLSLAD